MENLNTLQADTFRLSRAWNFIIPEKFELCRKYAEEKGEGVSVFRLLPEEETIEQNFNCTYNYILKDNPGWEIIFQNVPNRDKIFEVYDPSRHLIVSVHIPTVEGNENTVGCVRVFENHLDSDGNVIQIEG